MKKRIDNVHLISIIVILSTVLSKLLGLLREIKVAGALGASVESDAYNVAYLLIVTIFGLFSAAYSNSLMPIAAKLYEENRKQLQKTVNNIVTISVIIMLGIIAAVYICPTFFVKLLASGMDEETTLLAASLVKISVWALVALVILSALVIVLRIHDIDIYPTITDIVFSMPILIALFLGNESPATLISCVVLGYILRGVLLWIGTLKIKFHIHPCFQWKDKSVVSFFVMMPPMLLSSGLLQINTLVDNQVASIFGVGSVTALSQASKVNSLAYTVFSTSLMQTIYAKMTKAYAAGNMAHFEDIVKKQVKVILLFIIPCAIILPLFAKEIIQILFLRGNYTVEATEIAGTILSGYAMGLLFFVLRDICIYIFYSAHDSKTPTFITSIAVGINIILNLVLSRFIGIKGISYATSLSAIFSLVLLLFFMKKRVMPIKLISVKEGISIFLAGVLDLLLLMQVKSFFRGYNVWFSFVSFAFAFLFFWGAYAVFNVLIQKFSKIKQI